MNIALCTVSPLRYHQEATTITTINFAKALKKENHKVFVIARKIKDLPPYEEIADVPIYRLTKFPFTGKLFTPAFAIKEIQSKHNIQFDIIHSFSASPLFLLSSWSAKLFSKRTKLIHTLKSYPRDKYSRYFHFLLNLADSVTVPTEVFAEKLKRKKRIKVIRSFINLRKFRSRDKELLKRKHGCMGKKVILYYGSMAPWKGPQVFIEAIPEIITKNPETHIIFAPRSKDEAPHIQRVLNLGLDKHVDFIKREIPIEEFVNLADVIVLPYLSMIGTEGNPSCLLEAMAAKTAVVTTDLPELREIVTPEHDVLMAEPGKVESLAENVVRLLESPKLRRTLTENASLKVKEFDTEKVAKEFIELYAHLNQNF